MNHRKNPLSTLRSGILIFVMVLLGSIYSPLRDIPHVEFTTLVLVLVGAVLPGAALFVALGLELAQDEHQSLRI